jgi:hypothetical protein
MADLVCIKTFRNSMEAEVAKGLLETNGIFATIASSDGVVLGIGDVGIGSARLLVKDTDVQEALNLLGERTQKARETWTMSELSSLVADELARGQSREDVVTLLVRRGWPEVSARHFVENKAQKLPTQRESSRESTVTAEMYRRKMIRGLIWTVVGVILTAVMYRASSSTGSSMYFIWWGTVLFGLVDFVTGLIGWLSHRR